MPATLTAAEIKRFLTSHLAEQIRERGFEPDSITDDFDLLLEGVIDSMALVGLIGSLEDEFSIEVDLADLDPDDLTVIGPLSSHVAASATR